MKSLEPITTGYGKSLKPKKEKKKKFKIDLEFTPRGFLKGEFVDLYGAKCSIQESSLATDDAIWLGVDDANPQIMVSDAQKIGLVSTQENGWMSYPFPESVHFTTRMHLNRDQVKKLLPILRRFVKNGRLEK
jgi:hypothetical protein